MSPSSGTMQRDQGPSASGNTMFQRYLSKFAIQRGGAFTHTSIVKPGGSYYVPVEHMNDFYNHYCEALEHGEDLYITEKNRHISPIKIDLDFRWDVNDNMEVHGEHLYSPQHVHDIVQVYFKVIQDYFDIDDPDHLIAYVMEKQRSLNVTAGQQLKEGLHIMFPHLVSKASVQYLIRNDVMKELEEVFKNMKCSNPVTDIVDEAVIERNNWLMYGSKKQGGVPYIVTQVYTWNDANDDVIATSADPSLQSWDYVRMLSLRNKYDESNLKIEKTSAISAFEEEQEQRRKKMETARNIIVDKANCRTNECSDSDLEQIKKLVAILNERRANDYNDWIRLGWCLRNIDHRLLDAWETFSKRSSKYHQGECEKIWHHMKPGGLGIGTLHMWCRQDNIDSYKEIMRTDLRDLIFQSRSGTHNDVAQVIHYLYKYEYVCISIKNKFWYEFRGHRWVPCDGACTLRMKISNEVWREYMACARDWTQRAMDSPSAQDQSIFQEHAKRMGDIALKLKTTSYKDNLMKECSELFYMEKFEDLLDSYENLIGFNNGVFDLDTMEFREGRPEDYISYTTGNDYIEYDPTNKYVHAIKTYLSQVLPKPQVREYVLRLFATFLHGAIKEQKFYIWTGSGCHAKGTPIMMIDGTSKMVEDIKVGDVLMGDDSTPRNVLQLFRGHADMYKIAPTKGDPFVVNGDHVLSLKLTNILCVYNRKDKSLQWATKWMEADPVRVIVNRSKSFATREEADAHMEKIRACSSTLQEGAIIDVTVKDYLANIQRIGKRNLALYRPKFVEYKERTINQNLHPYVLGVWLGDGTSSITDITSADPEIIEHIQKLLPDTVQINEYPKEGSKAWRIKNDVQIALEEYGLFNNKHIPLDYRCNTREVRMQVLAGLIDTDGTYQQHTNQFIINQKNETLIDNTVSLVRSLGFSCFKKQIRAKCCNNGKWGTYYRINISGEGIEEIPTVLHRKQATERSKKKDVTKVGFKIERVEDGDYYGFELDGNHRYLMDDFIVTHNSNSKSLLVELFENSFGDYCCKFPITLLTMKRAASNAATSELARAKGKRFACLQEPSEDEKLNIGLMKELSGGDKIIARAIYKEPVEFKPQFKMVLLCNHLPHVPSDDGGTWRRIRVVEFISKFVDNPEGENEYPIDMELSKKMGAWRPHFLAMLIECYKLYKQEGIQEPEEVLSCTRDYKRNNDHLADFIHNCIEKKDSAFLSLNEAFAELKAWARDDNIPIKIPTKSELEKYLSKNMTKCVSNNHFKGFKGYRLKNRFQGVAEYAGDDGIDDA